MPQSIFCRSALTIIVNIDVVIDSHEATCRYDEGFVVGIEEASEVVHAFLDRENDAVQNDSIILKTKRNLLFIKPYIEKIQSLSEY